MPLVAHNDLPTFARLSDGGEEVLPLERARKQDIRELHIGFCNLMPDAAFEATERQFLRLIGRCNRIAQFFVHPFTFEEIPRGGAIREHVDRYYESWDQLAGDGLDALIITGANVTGAMEEQRFWPRLTEVLDFARSRVTSTLCACMATHAAIKHIYGVERARMDQKLWGVYSHRPTAHSHPLTRNINTRFEAPHSRHNTLTARRLEAVGIDVLIAGENGGVMLAVSPDGLRFVFMQGHPEYGRESLLKEYKREVLAFAAGERDEPPLPVSYFQGRGPELARRFVGDLRAGVAGPADFPEAELLDTVDNTWGDTASVLFANWLGLVYQLTGSDRRHPHMDGVDPERPLESL